VPDHSEHSPTTTAPTTQQLANQELSFSDVLMHQTGHR
jgi:hypothetical protein